MGTVLYEKGCLLIGSTRYAAMKLLLNVTSMFCLFHIIILDNALHAIWVTAGWRSPRHVGCRAKYKSIKGREGKGATNNRYQYQVLLIR